MARHRLFDLKRQGGMVRRVTPEGHLFYEGRWMWVPLREPAPDGVVMLAWPTRR